MRPPYARYLVTIEDLTAKQIEILDTHASADAYAEWVVPLPVATRVGWTCGERTLIRAGRTPPAGYAKYHLFRKDGLVQEDGSCVYSFRDNGHFDDHMVVFHFKAEVDMGLTYEDIPEIDLLYRGKLAGFGNLRDNPEAAAERGLVEKLGIQWSHIRGSVITLPSLPNYLVPR